MGNEKGQAMRTRSQRLLTQPLVGIVLSAVGVALVTVSWLVDPPLTGRSTLTTTDAVLALCLILSLYLAYQFPVHIRYTIKIEMSSVPLYLTAVLLPPAAAACTIGVGLVASELSMYRQRGSYPSDVAAVVGRWMAIGVAGSALAHATPAGYSTTYLALLGAAALVLLVGDLLTVPLQIAPVTGERYLHLVAECARGVSWAEAGQYFLGFIGALLAVQNVWYPALLFLPVTLVHRIAKRAKEMHESTRIFLEHMADQVDSKDAFTHEHSKRVTEWTQAMLRELNVVGPEAQLIVTAARVHDIGKLFLPDDILHKHDKLTAEEWAAMEKHPIIGADMLAKYPAFARGAAIVRGHHERIDGKGYPDRISGTNIPFGARVIAIADSFDAMTSDRPYRQGMTAQRAAAILSAGKGTQWDPELVDAFLRVIADQIELRTVEPHPAAAEAMATV
jgi:HD-GYP domain-containing protein (c-di-GMP phosphodiesterase class II)